VGPSCLEVAGEMPQYGVRRSCLVTCGTAVFGGVVRLG
jgi:hypothetical protein